MLRAIAVNAANNVAGHFGKAPEFVVYDAQGQLIERMTNSGSKAIGCKHKKQLQRRFSELGVQEIVLGSIGQRSLARLLQAGFVVSQVAARTPVSDVLAGTASKLNLTAAEQGRPCKREKGDCGCGCGSKKAATPKIGMVMNTMSRLPGLSRIKLK
ncbi:NifB/NifX family molybdenum-iron cluster-binding protein [Photobacterium kagoshimensis]|uniref:NifB/NifX family molybdenum-iron cluster-binding protein n=1 Tax=Photobacterium kagoshimensis TaxID=2910242 RepID=UPI003D0D872C